MSAPTYDTPEPFRVDVPERVLADLDERLRKARWPAAVDGADASSWPYGVDLDTLKELVDHWRHGYDWRVAEEKLNRFPQYLVDIDGQRLHFIREAGSEGDEGPRPLPLVLSHGWPGSTVEFMGIIDKLAHPERHGANPVDAFDVIVPSLPGYGFSGPPMRRNGSGVGKGPIGPRAIADLWHRLVRQRLNIERPYGAQGGDWGSAITTWLAFDHGAATETDSGMVGIHLNMMVLRPGIEERSTALSDQEKQWLVKTRAVRNRETAYQRIQSTKPQSLNVALNDSPVGLAAWILEKFHGWSDCKGKVLKHFDIDTLITNIMIYWINNSIGTANWLYRGVIDENSIALPLGKRVELPTGYARFPADLSPPPPRDWVERAFNLRRFTEMPQGGHFAALEAPDLLVEDIREFFRPLRFGVANDS
jgi:microsomal epoxide hydrolase